MSKNCPNFLLCGNTIYLEEPIMLIIFYNIYTK